MSTVVNARQNNPHQPVSALNLCLPAAAHDIKRLSQTPPPGELINQFWLKPGHEQALTSGDNNAVRISIYHFRRVGGEFESALIPSFRGKKMRSIPLKYNAIDLRFLNELFLVARMHRINDDGKPLETLIDVYRVPMSLAIAI